MDINVAFPSNYLRAVDLMPNGQPVETTVTIARITMEELGQGAQKDNKAVAYFSGKDKGVALNKTNASVIADAYGTETDGWIGKIVVLVPRQVEFQGKLVWAIRIRIPAPATAGAAPDTGAGFQQPAAGAVADEDIQF